MTSALATTPLPSQTGQTLGEWTKQYMATRQKYYAGGGAPIPAVNRTPVDIAYQMTHMNGGKLQDYATYNPIEPPESPNWALRLLDIISRPLYATANLSREIVKNVQDDEDANTNPFSALWAGFSGQTKTTYADVIEEINPNAPDWVKGVGGFLGDVVLDPLNVVPGIGFVKYGARAGKKAGDLAAQTAEAAANRAAAATPPPPPGAAPGSPPGGIGPLPRPVPPAGGSNRAQGIPGTYRNVTGAGVPPQAGNARAYARSAGIASGRDGNRVVGVEPIRDTPIGPEANPLTNAVNQTQGARAIENVPYPRAAGASFEAGPSGVSIADFGRREQHTGFAEAASTEAHFRRLNDTLAKSEVFRYDSGAMDRLLASVGGDPESVLRMTAQQKKAWKAEVKSFLHPEDYTYITRARSGDTMIERIFNLADRTKAADSIKTADDFIAAAKSGTLTPASITEITSKFGVQTIEEIPAAYKAAQEAMHSARSNLEAKWRNKPGQMDEAVATAQGVKAEAAIADDVAENIGRQADEAPEAAAEVGIAAPGTHRPGEAPVAPGAAGEAAPATTARTVEDYERSEHKGHRYIAEQMRVVEKLEELKARQTNPRKVDELDERIASAQREITRFQKSSPPLSGAAPTPTSATPKVKVGITPKAAEQITQNAVKARHSEKGWKSDQLIMEATRYAKGMTDEVDVVTGSSHFDNWLAAYDDEVGMYGRGFGELPETQTAKHARFKYQTALPYMEASERAFGEAGLPIKLTSLDSGAQYIAGPSDIFKALPDEIVEKYQFTPGNKKSTPALYGSMWQDGAAKALDLAQSSMPLAEKAAAIAKAMTQKGNGPVTRSSSIIAVSNAMADPAFAASLRAAVVENTTKYAIKDTKDAAIMSAAAISHARQAITDPSVPMGEAIQVAANPAGGLKAMADNMGASDNALFMAAADTADDIAKMITPQDTVMARGAVANERTATTKGFKDAEAAEKSKNRNIDDLRKAAEGDVDDYLKSVQDNLLAEKAAAATPPPSAAGGMPPGAAAGAATPPPGAVPPTGGSGMPPGPPAGGAGGMPPGPPTPPRNPAGPGSVPPGTPNPGQAQFVVDTLALSERAHIEHNSMVSRMLHPVREKVTFGYQQGWVAHEGRSFADAAQSFQNGINKATRIMSKKFLPDDLKAAFASLQRGDQAASATIQDAMDHIESAIKFAFEVPAGQSLRSFVVRNGIDLKTFNKSLADNGVPFQFDVNARIVDAALVNDKTAKLAHLRSTRAPAAETRAAQRELKAAERGRPAREDEIINQWRQWNVEDVPGFIRNLNGAVADNAARRALGARFSEFGYATLPPGANPKDFVRVNVDNTIMGGHIKKDLLYPREAVKYMQEYENMLKQAKLPGKEGGALQKFVAQMFDPMMTAWKTYMTIVNPGHHMRNVYSELLFNWNRNVRNPKRYAETDRLHAKWKGLKAGEGYANPFEAMRAVRGDIPLANPSTAIHTTIKLKGGKTAQLTDDDLLRYMLDNGIFINFQAREDLLETKNFGNVTKKILDNKLTRAGGRASEYTGNMGRGADFMTQIQYAKVSQQFDNVEDLMKYVTQDIKKAHPDSGGLTPWERKDARRIMPFYSWYRQALPSAAKSLMQRPWKIAQVPKAYYNAAIAMGANPYELSDPFPKDALIPGFLKQGITGPVFDGLAFGTGSPVETLAQQFGGDSDRGGWFGQTSRTLMGQMNPLLTASAQLLTGTELQSGTPIVDKGEFLNKYVPVAGNLSRISGYDVMGSLGSGTLDPTRDMARGYKDSFLNRSLVNFLFGTGAVNTQQENFQYIAAKNIRETGKP